MVSNLKRKKLLYLFFGIFAIAFSIFMLIKQFEVTVSCVPNEDNSAVQMIAQNATIDEITLKYNNGILQVEPESKQLSINDKGVEYIRVHYTDRNNNQHHVDFEIVVSEYNAISVSKLNAVGQQIEFHTY